MTPGPPWGGSPATRASTRRLSGLCSVTLSWARRCSTSQCSTIPLSIDRRIGRLCATAGRHRPKGPNPIRLPRCALRPRSRCGPCGAESRRITRRLHGLRGTGAPLVDGLAPLRAGSALRHGSLCDLRSSPRACPRRYRSRPTTDGRGHPSGTVADLEVRWAMAAHRERLGSRPDPACRNGRSVPVGRRPWPLTRMRPLGSTAVQVRPVPLSSPDPARRRGSAPTLGGSSSSWSSSSGASSGESEWPRSRRMMFFSPALW